MTLCAAFTDRCSTQPLRLIPWKDSYPWGPKDGVRSSSVTKGLSQHTKRWFLYLKRQTLYLHKTRQQTDWLHLCTSSNQIPRDRNMCCSRNYEKVLPLKQKHVAMLIIIKTTVHKKLLFKTNSLLQAILITPNFYYTWCRTIIEKLIVTQMVKMLPHFTELEGLLLCSQKPNHNPVESSAHIHAIFLDGHEDKCKLRN